MKWLLVPALAAGALAAAALAEVHTHPGGKELPHDQYIRTVSEADSPLERLYIKTKDGLYVAAVLRKPKGAGPFPVLIQFHGAPGGRGMEKLVEWSLGTTGGPLWERFLQEGYVVVTADYRGVAPSTMADPLPAAHATYVDDALAVVEHVRNLPYVDSNRISVYGVSLGGNVVLHLLGRTKLHAAVLGAPAPMSFLGARPNAGATGAERWKNVAIDHDLARRNIEPIATPILILVGTADSLIAVNRPLHDLLEKAGKRVRMDIYENGYHDFVLGPQGHPGRKEPLLDATLDALELTLAFVRSPGSGSLP